MGGFNSQSKPDGGNADGNIELGGGASSSADHTAPPPSSSDGVLGGLSSGGLKLTAPVGPGAANKPGDVLRVETVLKGANFLARAPGREFGGDTLAAIRAAQGSLNADPRMDLLAETPLKQDGLVNPAGPTETATRKLAAGVLAERDPMTLEPVAPPRPPEPRTPRPKAPWPEATGMETVATPAGPRRETLEQTAKRFAKSGPMTKPAAAPKPAPDLSAPDFASLQRLAAGVRKTTRPGAAAKDIADAFRAEPKRTAGEFVVVRDALARGGTESQVKNLTEGVRAELAPDERDRFDRLVGPGGEGWKDETPGGKLPSPIRDAGPPTDKPVDRDQMFKKLDFDPDSKIGEYFHATEAPLSAWRVKNLPEEADMEMKAQIRKGRLPAGRPHDNKADAFRHAFWSYRATQEIGADAAKRFGDGHEITARNKDSERLMDLYNNNVGRRLALDPNTRDRDATEVILEAIRNGELQTRPFLIK